MIYGLEGSQLTQGVVRIMFVKEILNKANFDKKKRIIVLAEENICSRGARLKWERNEEEGTMRQQYAFQDRANKD